MYTYILERVDIMGGLSDRVMNMKFMKKTDVNKESDIKEDQLKKIKDTSEWVLPNASKLRSRNQGSNVVESIGYASINSFAGMESLAEEVEDQVMPANVGRRTWGGQEAKEEQSDLNITKLKDSVTKNTGKPQKNADKSEDKNAADNEPELDTKDFLESLWNKSQKPNEKGSKKRKNDKKDEYVPDIKNKRKRFPNA